MSIGETLRQARLESGLTLNEISGQTRINLNLLHAIEADELHKLPNGAIGRSFVKQYAQIVGLGNSDLEKELAEFSSPAAPSFRQVPDSFRPRVAPMNERPRADGSLVASLLWVCAAIAFCSVVYWLLTRPHAPSSAPHPVPAQQNSAK